MVSAFQVVAAAAEVVLLAGLVVDHVRDELAALIVACSTEPSLSPLLKRKVPAKPNVLL